MPHPVSRRAARALLFSFLLLGSIPGTLAAQARLVGMTRITPLVLTQDTTTCAPLPCTPSGISAPPAGFAWVGGTAYDSNTRGVWISNGLLIAKVDARNGCTPQCPVLPAPNTTPNNPVTGLAYHEPTNHVYITDQSGVIRWYSVGGGCQLSLVARCLAPIAAGDVLTGCATDDKAGRIFYCSITPGTPGGRVFVAPIGTPCAPICSFPVTTCGSSTMGQLQGLAYDACADVLWVTDGRFTTGLSIPSPSCTPVPVQCCINTGEPYIGLDVLANNEVAVGPNCTAGSCPSCATMVHSLGSDPYFGNAAFSLDLDNAPGATPAWLLFNVGASTPPVFSPPLCAGIRVLGFSFGVVTSGAPGVCNGAVTLNFPLPLNPSLCGVTCSSQYLGLCGGLTDSYVSNALDWTIGGS